VPNAPTAPVAATVVQPTCGLPSGSIAIAAQSGVEYSLDGVTYVSGNTFLGLTPNSYTLYVRNLTDATCVTQSALAVKINAVPNAPTAPVAATVVQPTCGLPSGTITIAAQSGVEYSLDGVAYVSDNTFLGLAPNNYTLYVRNIADATCVTQSALAVKINAVPNAPTAPVAATIMQPTCGLPSGSITIAAQSGVEYSLDGVTYVSDNTFIGLTPNSYTLYVRNLTDATCVTSSTLPVVIDAIPLPPTAPVAATVVQPTCGLPSGSITITVQSGVEYSLDGVAYVSDNTFLGLAPNSYTLYVRNIADATCVTSSTLPVMIDAIPLPPTAPVAATIVQPTCGLPSGTIIIETQSGVEYSLDGVTYVSDNTFIGIAPNSYTLYVRNLADITCVTSSTLPVVIDAIPLPPTAPVTSTVVQPICGLPSGSITIAAQSGVEYSLDGVAYVSDNTFIGIAPNSYTLYVRNLADATCVTSSTLPVMIDAIPLPPTAPVAATIVQPTCGLPSGSITIAAQSGVEYSLNGTTYVLGNTFLGLAPNNYTLYVRNLADATCVTSSTLPVMIDAIPLPPTAPVAATIVQPTCGLPSGTIIIETQSGVEYSLDGVTYVLDNVFIGLTPNSYTLYVRNLADATCVTSSALPVIIDSPSVVLVPTATSVVQPTCAIQSGTITISSQAGIEYSLDGLTYQSSTIFSGLAPNSYTLYARNSTDVTCVSTSLVGVVINAIPTAPQEPIAASIVQPTCVVSSGIITVAVQAGVEYSLNGTDYQLNPVFEGLAPKGYVLYVRNIKDATCVMQSAATSIINPLPPLPSAPSVSAVIQPRCDIPTGTIELEAQTGVQYSIGTGFQDSNVFSNLAPGKYPVSVRFVTSPECISTGSTQKISSIPPDIAFETVGDCDNKIYTLTASPLSGSYDSNTVTYEWKDKQGAVIAGATTNVLNVTETVAATPDKEQFPLTYTLTITAATTGCKTTASATIQSIYCDIQKGISPDGNGSNDFFDLRLMDVKKIEIFNRYGIQVYSQDNYTDQWVGQSTKGDELPSATYYYAIEFNSGETKTGWIYLIREK
ncbi:gliding motility-associated C-terminal domain-containing protein, partial [Flavobacterium restrictum]